MRNIDLPGAAEFSCACLVIGAGLTGGVIARELAEKGEQVWLLEKRNHIGGNLYDEVDEHGILVQRYGPHAFHTNDEKLYHYLCRFEEWKPYKLRCGAVLNSTFTPTPFNFTTIDMFYTATKAERLKKKLREAFPNRESVSVREILNHTDEEIHAYGAFLFQKDYQPYTAKQWGRKPEEIDPGILDRVPVRLSYRDAYFDDRIQVLPKHSYSRFFRNLLNHPNIHVFCETDALEHLSVRETKLLWDNEVLTGRVYYTGALDMLFGGCFGWLPYRSLKFQWEYAETDRLQSAPVVAFPEAEGYTRITDFKQLPEQDGSGTSYALEFPLPYDGDKGTEPFYPVLTVESRAQFARYRALADKIPNLTVCGRLGDFQYYNMDQALARALGVSAGNEK